MKLSKTVVLFAAFALTACGGVDELSSAGNTAAKLEKRPDRITVMFEHRNPIKYEPKHKKQLVTFKDYIGAAIEAEEQRAYDDALAFSKQAVKLKKDSGIAHYYYGKSLLYTVSGEMDAGVKELEKAVDLGFENADLYENLAVYYNGKKQFGKTIELLNRAIKLNSRSKGLYKFRGSVYRQLGEIDKAEKDYNEQIKISARRFKSGSYRNRATFYASLGRYEDALKDYRRAFEAAGKHSFLAKRKCADMLIKLNRVDEAIKELTEVIKLDPRDDDAYRMRGNLYTKKKQYSMALSDYNTSIELNPEFARQSYLDRAELFEAMGKKDKATRDRNTARAIEKKPAEKTLFTISDD